MPDLEEELQRLRESALGFVVGAPSTVASADGAVEWREAAVTDPLEGRRYRLVQVTADDRALL